MAGSTNGFAPPPQDPDGGATITRRFAMPRLPTATATLAPGFNVLLRAASFGAMSPARSNAGAAGNRWRTRAILGKASSATANVGGTGCAAVMSPA